MDKIDKIKAILASSLPDDLKLELIALLMAQPQAQIVPFYPTYPVYPVTPWYQPPTFNPYIVTYGGAEPQSGNWS